MKIQKIVFYATTGILTLIMCFSAYNYFANYEMVAGFFEAFNYPTYIIYPLAIAKILGLVAILGNFSKWLKEWAYAGFFFDLVLAFAAHAVAKDGGHMFALVAIVALMISYFLEKKVRP